MARLLTLLSVALLLLALSPWARAEAVRVDGEGFLRFVRDGRVVYAKEAELVARDGRLCHRLGPAVIPSITVGSTFEIDLEGNVRSGGVVVGRLVLATFAVPVSKIEEGFLVSPERPKLGNPGEGVIGVVRSTRTAISGPTPQPAVAPALSKGVRI